MANDVTVEFGARTDDIDRGSAAVKAKLQELQNQTNAMSSSMGTFGSTVNDAFSSAENSISGLNDQFKSLNESIQKGGATLDTGWMKLLLGAGIGGAVAGVVTVFHNLEEEFLKMDRNAREAGLSLQRFQEIQYTLAKSGVGTDKMVSDLANITKALIDANYDAGSLGKFFDANNMKLKDSAGHIVSTNAYLEQAAAILQRAVAEGGDPLAFKVGEILKLSKDTVRALEGGPGALRLMSSEAHTVGAVFSDEIINRSVQFEKEWNAASLRWSTYLKSLLVGLIPYVENLIKSFTDGVDAIINKVNDWGKAYDRLHPKGEGLLDTVRKTWDAWKGVSSETERFGAIWDAQMHGTETFSQRFDAAKGSITVLADKAKELLTTSNATANAWKNADGEMEEMVSTGKKFAEIKFPVEKDKFDIEGLRKLQEELDKVREKYQQQKIIEQTAVDTFKETETEKYNHLKAALDQREAATKAIGEKEVKLAEDNAGRKAAIERQLSKDLASLQTERLKLNEEYLKKETREWESFLSGISGAFTSQLRGILTGTTSWSQAIKNIMLDLVLKIIDEFLKLAVIKPLSGMLASALEAPAEIFADIIKVIKNMFGPLLAGFTSFFAPVQGPAAPAEGAALASATVATAVGAVALAAGTDYVPRTGLALLHQGEAVIPATANVQPFTGGSHTFNINLSAVDVQSFNAWLKNGGGGNMLAKMISDILNKNPSLRPSY